MTLAAWITALLVAAGSIVWIGRRPAAVESPWPFVQVHLVAFGVGFCVAALGGGSFFGLFAVGWGLGVGASVSLSVLGWRLRASRPLGAGLSWLGAATAATIAVYGLYIGPYQLEVNVHRIESARVSSPLRVAIVADLQTDHIGPYEERVFATLAGLDADLLILPGDFLQLYGDRRPVESARLDAEFEAVRPAFALGIYGVDGDVEYGGTPLPAAVTSLSDRLVTLPGRADVQLAGLSLGRSADPAPPWPEARAGFAGLTLVVGHRPDYMWPALRGDDTAPGVLIAGHTHGGQIVIPGFGPPLTLSTVPRHIAAGGLHATGPEQWAIVSRGVGLERGAAPRVRLFCPPEIVVLDIVPPAR